ncbi:MAG: hypothetical protein ACD_7C00165G0008 [uncultured bacterium]|nr:MAG: hypothetical protein ACD_7C00165G0008 [uncultured bacterium]KKP68745.1 MAG: Alpha/beta hydrolase fold protein [Candidatus Moranbacteria bacterium GW2011_GWE1_35_17]KKP82936.1 MAG: Alpha/beta hydrolase fold protein [Candidatus Moranbacteria bacterium GW2011_GWF1_35_5]KKP83306.1 MAG: Alpha/beta hydrolase fold protein [Candidatus Moranbacteria bacterium GW2011_GWF2_35_54]HBR78846.1 hypothetical protein [Candidatus Moranbacteria bacterium]
MVGKILKKTKSILFANPRVLYESERHLVNKSFYFKGVNNKAVLLLHGWTAVPYELRRLGIYLNEAGYTVYGPMLSGHGTKPADLEKVTYEDWLNDSRRAYHKLKKEYAEVFVGGTSMGATLSIELAKENADIKGLILLATPYKIKLEKVGRILTIIFSWFKKYQKKFYPPTFGFKGTITRDISYQVYPIKSVLELGKLIELSRKDLEKIKQPCLIMQSSSDHIITRGSLKRIYEKISSNVKKKKYIKKSYHTFISDIKNEHVFEEILNFIKSI